MVLMLLPAGGSPALAGEASVDKTSVDVDLLPARSYYYRVERDVRRYVRHLDRYLDLNRRQRRRIRRLLTRRTYDLLGYTRPARHHRVYPFPRHKGYGQGRRLHRWWNLTDQRIEWHLNRRQTRKFRRLTRDAYYSKHRYDDRYDHYKYDDHYDHYEDRYDHDDPYDDRRNRRDKRRPRRNGKKH